MNVKKVCASFDHGNSISLVLKKNMLTSNYILDWTNKNKTKL
jgi:hypothetical protein